MNVEKKQIVHNTFNLTGFSLDKLKTSNTGEGNDQEIVKKQSKLKNQSPKKKKSIR